MNKFLFWFLKGPVEVIHRIGKTLYYSNVAISKEESILFLFNFSLHKFILLDFFPAKSLASTLFNCLSGWQSLIAAWKQDTCMSIIGSEV